jgi:polygalacturonase
LLWVNGLTISNLHLTNSPFWTTHPTFCDNVLVINLDISAPATSHNTDGIVLSHLFWTHMTGIDPDSCSNVFISNCTISTGGPCHACSIIIITLQTTALL